MNQTWSTSGVVFLLSIFCCIIPRVVHKWRFINRAIPYATLLSAGFLLAVFILDFIPHMFSHDANVDHEKEEFRSRIALLVSGLSFLFLLGIDSVVLKHDHCEEEPKQSCGAQETDGILKENKSSPVDTTVVVNHDHAKHTHKEEGGCCNTDVIKKSNSISKVLIFIIGISIHSFFEGLAFKCSETGFFGGYEVSIIMHKILESFSIGLAFIETKLSKTVELLLISFYAFLTPLGMLLGFYLSDKDHYLFDIPVQLLCNGLALGSLMFIVFIEMIAASIHKPGNNLIRLAVISAGFIIASTVIMNTPHSHGSHSSCGHEGHKAHSSCGHEGHKSHSSCGHEGHSH
ncbi:Protein zntC [Nosema granulosis]|uniref:Protein zntC n=1 Tax=Nosema granulosis TaxID=83296 RepID=A0A9P6GZA7_9MICR|nr:Protein zntC [Nosema granulosis]